MEMPVLVRSLKSSILSLTSSRMGNTFWGVVSAAKELRANIAAQGYGIFGPEADPRISLKKKKKEKEKKKQKT